MNATTKVLLSVVLVAVVAAVTMPAMGDSLSEQKKAQNKLLAARAARVDAMRKLAERINGLMITSETTVKDFVATNDRIQTAMMAYLSGMKEVGKPQYMEDGTCEVTLEITMREVVVTLKKLYKEYYKGDKIRIQDIEKMTVTNKDTVLRETGAGAPRPEFEERGQAFQTGQAQAGSLPMSAQAKAFWMAHVTGRGRLMAVQAARVVAQRRLGERINGLMITSETSVRDFVAESDEINTQMRSFLRGAKEVGTLYHDDELIVEVEMEVTLKRLIANLKRWYKEYYKGNRVRIQDFEQLTVRTETKKIRETGMGVPPEKYLKDVPAEGVAAIAFAGNANNWPPTIKAVGQAAIDVDNANAAQAKLMAYRAAELDARRKLAEEIDGLMINSETSVRDFVAENDEIETSMLTYQQGARRVKGSEKIMEDGTVEVTVEIDTEPLWNVVLFYWQRR